ASPPDMFALADSFASDDGTDPLCGATDPFSDSPLFAGVSPSVTAVSDTDSGQFPALTLFSGETPYVTPSATSESDIDAGSGALPVDAHGATAYVIDTGLSGLSIAVERQEEMQLHLHLVALYFASLNPCISIIDEETFYEDWLPINRYATLRTRVLTFIVTPSQRLPPNLASSPTLPLHRHPIPLLHAMFAHACLHSQHPLLSEPLYSSPFEAATAFFEKATSGCEGIQDSVVYIQVTVLLGFFDFGSNVTGKPLDLIGSALREMECIQLGYGKDPTDSSIASIWNSPGAISRTRTFVDLALERRTFSYAFLADTFSAMALGNIPVLDETLYSFLLGDAVDQCANDYIGRPTRFVAPPPSYTIHELRPAKWDAPKNDLRNFCARSTPFAIQLSYIVRRVLRFVAAAGKSAPWGPLSPSAES
ncbi:hypothetical protein BDK51DRAFT_38832, partial [Blyttiomyces helicus]